MAAKWDKKAADGGDVNAQMDLSMMYYYGKGVSQDAKAAIKYYEMAAAQCPKCPAGFEGIFGIHYMRKGKPDDVKRAITLFEDGAQRGDARCQAAMGYNYEKGLGVKKNLEKAAFWNMKSAAQGFAIGEFNLGVLYEKGWGVPKDIEIAKKWYLKAAAQGDKGAKERLKKFWPKYFSDPS